MKLIKLPKILYFEYEEIAVEENRPFPKIIKETKQNIFVEQIYNNALRSLYYEAQYWGNEIWSYDGTSRTSIHRSAKYTMLAINKYYGYLTKLENWSNCFDRHGNFKSLLFT